MYFVYTFKTNPHVLHRIEETHKLLNRRIELTDDELHGKHHTECELSVNNGCCRDYCNNDILEFVDKDAACLLWSAGVSAISSVLQRGLLARLPIPNDGVVHSLAVLSPA